MKKLKFSKDEGNEFYKELNNEVDQYFAEKGISKFGNETMIFKIIMYFSLDILFYFLIITIFITLSSIEFFMKYWNLTT